MLEYKYDYSTYVRYPRLYQIQVAHRFIVRV